MSLRPNFDYNKPLPEKYEAKMPSHIKTAYDKYQWREHVVAGLYADGLISVDENNNFVFPKDDPDERTNSEANKEEVRENTEVDNIESVVSEIKEEIVVEKPKRKTNKKIQSKDDNYVEFVRDLPKSVMDSLRKLFVTSASKSDMISAAVYILTKGDCEISDKAMSLVEQYNAEDKLDSIEERLSRLERLNKKQLDLLYSTELAACYIAFDRRYGSSAPRTGPKTNEFREPENLDMLERLREQARDQRHIDDLITGRTIYDQIKDKNE